MCSSIKMQIKFRQFAYIRRFNWHISDTNHSMWVILALIVHWDFGICTGMAKFVSLIKDMSYLALFRFKSNIIKIQA